MPYTNCIDKLKEYLRNDPVHFVERARLTRKYSLANSTKSAGLFNYNVLERIFLVRKGTFSYLPLTLASIGKNEVRSKVNKINCWYEKYLYLIQTLISNRVFALRTLQEVTLYYHKPLVPLLEE